MIPVYQCFILSLISQWMTWHLMFPQKAAAQICQRPDLLPLIENVFLGANEDANSSTAIIDCSFEGRVWGDTTSLKIYLLDHSTSQITTLTVQTIRGHFLRKQLKIPIGAAVMSTFDLNRMTAATHFDPADGVFGIATTQVVNYSLLYSKEFPYQLNPFESVHVDNFSAIPLTGTINNSKERVVIYGVDGIYRKDASMQSAIQLFTWTNEQDNLRQSIFPLSIEHFQRVKIRGLGCSL